MFQPGDLVLYGKYQGVIFSAYKKESYLVELHNYLGHYRIHKLISGDKLMYWEQMSLF